MWRRMAQVGALGLVVTGIFVWATNKHPHGAPVQYPHMHIRNKPFPWADGDTGLFEQVGGKHTPGKEH